MCKLMYNLPRKNLLSLIAPSSNFPDGKFPKELETRNLFTGKRRLSKFTVEEFFKEGVRYSNFGFENCTRHRVTGGLEGIYFLMRRLSEEAHRRFDSPKGVAALLSDTGCFKITDKKCIRLILELVETKREKSSKHDRINLVSKNSNENLRNRNEFLFGHFFLVSARGTH
ncbi:uncharacterized protein LOC143148072 [Ptiloglossa arizonensis]|uniref:uncharacterized protein LOC143148072 n=1 Tax=Ptiloglossa arizonensis TaxID=3350558 RepID=UPI003FA0510E